MAQVAALDDGFYVMPRRRCCRHESNFAGRILMPVFAACIFTGPADHAECMSFAVFFDDDFYVALFVVTKAERREEEGIANLYSLAIGIFLGCGARHLQIGHAGNYGIADNAMLIQHPMGKRTESSGVDFALR